MSELDGELPAARAFRVRPEGPVVVRVDVPGGAPWVMTSDYARDLAAMIQGAALTIDLLNAANEEAAR